MYLFYCPDIEKEQTLSEEESGHGVRVLRYTTGDGAYHESASETLRF